MHYLLYALHGFPKSPRSRRKGRYVLQASYDEQIARVLDEVRGQTVDQAKEWLGRWVAKRNGGKPISNSEGM